MIKPPQIASVLDVLRVYAEGFVGTSKFLATLSTLLKKQGAEYTLEGDPAALADMISKFRQRCESLNLPMSAKQLQAVEDRIREYIDRADNSELQRLIDDALARLQDELSLRRVYILEPVFGHFFDDSSLFGVEVEQRFPEATDDIAEAGKCLALDRGTACVFHLMRVLEIGLQEFGTRIGLTEIDQNWQRLLGNVIGAIRRLPNSTAAEKAFMGKASEIAAHLQHVKDAWRNDVMHPKASYTPAQALEIWGHAKPLMSKIADFV